MRFSPQIDLTDATDRPTDRPTDRRDRSYVSQMRRTALALAQKTMGFTKQLIREGVSAAWAIGFSFRSLFLVEQNGYLHVAMSCFLQAITQSTLNPSTCLLPLICFVACFRRILPERDKAFPWSTGNRPLHGLWQESRPQGKVLEYERSRARAVHVCGRARPSNQR